MAAERVKRLKDLVDRLERLPASEDRDRVLREVRSRAVDVDTGVTPRAMLPVQEPILAEPAPKRVRITRTVAPPSPRPVQVDSSEWFSMDELLSLEDTPPPTAAQDVPAWTLGLRG